jgi:hypothetical protein
MRRLAAVPVLLCASLAPSGRAADTDSIESTVRALYDSISGPAGARDWARFRSLFAAGARLVPMRVTPEGTAPTVLTVDEYVTRAGANFEKAPFYESEISRRIDSFGGMAHVFSTYESRRGPGQKPFARGINSIQLVLDGKAWRIMTVLWDAEREGNPIPAKYLNSPPPSHVAAGGGRGGTGRVVSPQPPGD